MNPEPESKKTINDGTMDLESIRTEMEVLNDEVVRRLYLDINGRTMDEIGAMLAPLNKL